MPIVDSKSQKNSSKIFETFKEIDTTVWEIWMNL